MAGALVGLTVAKNEADIIEAMVRHNLGFLDGLHIIDNDSADATPDILEALAIEFSGRLTWEIDRRTGHLQTAFVNAALGPLLARTGATQIVLLDADEFVRADPAVFREMLLAVRLPVLLPWVTYVPTANDDASVLNPSERITHRRRRERQQFYKVTVPAHLVGKVRVMPGNHRLRGAGEDAAIKPEGLSLAHFPVRSVEQLTSKVLIGAWNMRLRAKRGPNEGYHWHELAARVLAGQALTEADLQIVAMGYSARKATGIRPDPLAPCGTVALKYTPDGKANLMRNLAAFTESCVRLIESTSGRGIPTESSGQG
mgnify:CR=1 FL=1